MSTRSSSAAVSRTRLIAAVLGFVVSFPVAFGGSTLVRAWLQRDACTPAHPGWSVARQWDEAVLDAIRRDIPNPPVHARNLFHLSVAMWDAWAAYDQSAQGYVTPEKVHSAHPEADRRTAISYAAYRILESRYARAVGASDSIPQFDALMRALCYPVDVTITQGDGPAALGNRIAAAVLAAGRDDQANESGAYAAAGYRAANPPLVVAASGTSMKDPNRWQPLEIKQPVTQNGIPVENAVQTALGVHWGHVTSFALPDGGATGVPIDPGPPPRLGDPVTDQAFKQAAVEVIRFSSEVDPDDGVRLDISPAALGANPLGTYDGTGHRKNPATGRPYQPDVVDRADYMRSVAEFWADGPRSETPPGHWNTIANAVSDRLAPRLRVGGTGPVLDRLQWDVKLYLALNGAVHDAAVAAWGLKGHYDSSRPISMIRYMGGRGQSSDPSAPAYDVEGLPLVPGLIEVITAESSAPGQRHAALAKHVGEIAIRAWAGRPADPKTEHGGVRWSRAVDWVPYQMPSFVTPSFPGYVSGHSSFSRAAAEVLTGITGDAYFPGGLFAWTVPARSLTFEAGPSTDMVLQWATYRDAADQAGISRLYGGIHIRADDLEGRIIGHDCGVAAWAKAQRYFGGSA